MSIVVNPLTGLSISRVKVRTLAVVSAAITMIASPLMATIDIHEPYWRTAFWTMLVAPVNSDGRSAFPHPPIRVLELCG